MESRKTRTERLVRLIAESPDSPIHDFIQRDVPETDMAYLQLMFDFVKYSKNDENNFSKLLFEGWLTHDRTEELFPLRYTVWRRVRYLVVEAMEEKLSSMSFQPRIENYLGKFDGEEIQCVRLLLLAYLNAILENNPRFDLIDAGSYSPKLQRYILSMNEHHPIFLDKVLELESSRFGEDKSFFQKTLVLNSAIFKVFAGFDVTEEEVLLLEGSPLVDLFGLSTSDLGREPVNHKDAEKNPDEDMATFEGPVEDSIEAYIRFMQEMEEVEDSEEEEDDSWDLDSEDEPEWLIVDDGTDHGELNVFTDDLDYLYGEYCWLNHLVESKTLAERSFLDREDQRKIMLLEQQAEKQKKICEARLKKTVANGFRPRLDVFANLLKLEMEERQIFVVLLVNRLFGLDDNDFGRTSVGDVLKILYVHAIERVRAKRFFMKHAKLVKSNIIHLESSGLSNDLMQCSIEVDNRLLEYFIGEDYDISNYVEGSRLSSSTILLENVVLPEESKQTLVEMIDHFPTFLDVKRKYDFSSVVQYGDSLVLLFVGPSGTGKTMLANALANYLAKKILLINVNDRSNLTFSNYNDDAKLPVLFREARMHDAILFFDEAEEMLEERKNDLLIEIEKHKGIVIFATNATFTIDDALRRRINHIHHFQEPGASLRKRIWNLHLPKAVPLDGDVDLDLLAQRYEINGGLIKNAVFFALAKAAGEQSDTITLSMRHLSEGASEQLGNKLFMSNLEEHVVPTQGLDSVVLAESTKGILEELVHIEKARKVLIGEWGFDKIFPDHNGTAVLFHGPSGTGKTKTAEALAFETGKRLKIVNYAQVVSMWVGGTEKALETLFKEVADDQSILLFDEADALFSKRVGISSSNDRYVNIETDVLLRMIERFNSMAILTTNVFDHIDSAFLRRMQYIVGFERPDERLRRQLWNQLVPEKLPLSCDVNFDTLAHQFDFTGGEIKKAIIGAATKLAIKLERNSNIGMEDFIAACKEVDVAREKRNRTIGFICDPAPGI